MNKGADGVHWANLAFAAMIFGAVFLFYGIRTFTQLQRARDWAPVTAVVTASDIEPIIDGPDQVRIRYRYEIDGHSFDSSRLGFGMGMTTGRARRFANQYRPGDTTTVWYNPRAPHEAVLLRGSRRTSLALIGTGVALGWLAFASRRRYHALSARS